MKWAVPLHESLDIQTLFSNLQNSQPPNLALFEMDMISFIVSRIRTTFYRVMNSSNLSRISKQTIFMDSEIPVNFYEVLSYVSFLKQGILICWGFFSSEKMYCLIPF